MKLTRITHRELLLGDVVSLDFPTDGGRCFQMAKVVRMTDSLITFARPWMPADDRGYLDVQIELFDVFRDSDKTVSLVSRQERE